MKEPLQKFDRSSIRSIALLSGMLLLFIGGIYGISGLYELGRGNSRTVTLPAEQLPSSLAEIPGTTVKIESVIRQSFDFPIYNIQAVDHNRVLMNRAEDSYSGISLSMLQMDEKEITDIASNVEFGFSLSEDNEELNYTKYGRDWNETSMLSYRLDSGEEKLITESSLFMVSYIGDNEFIGLNSEGLNLMISRNGVEETLYGYDEITERIAQASGAKQAGEVIFFSFYQISRDKQSIYLMAQVENGYSLYQFGLNDRDEVVEIATAEEIEQFIELGEGKFVILGKIDGKSGVYVWDSETKSRVLLAEGQIWNISMDAELARLAYYSVDDAQNNELHVVHLENGRILTDTVIYRNIENIQLLQWNGNDLFLSAGDYETSELYRFTLSAW